MAIGTVKIAAIIVILIVAVAVVYVAMTFPRAIANLPVAFSAGPDQKKTEFEVPPFNDKIQVEVTLSGNSTSWVAEIENSNGDNLWTSPPADVNQTIYHSAWIAISSGRYNFTFTSIGPDSLSADIHLTSKGGFW